MSKAAGRSNNARATVFPEATYADISFLILRSVVSVESVVWWTL